MFTTDCTICGVEISNGTEAAGLTWGSIEETSEGFVSDSSPWTEVICKDCGLVIEDKMVSFDQEWREFEDSDASQRRTGAPTTYTKYDQGLGTEIGQKSDLYGLEGKERSSK
jgi:transcription initiation factor TFIIIB Brf1 subunit/transcription initiation factor TFIIB